MATDEQGYRGVPHQAAVLVNSARWRSVHLAAPPLLNHRLTPQELADLAPTVPDNTNARLLEYLRFHQYATIRITEALRLLPETHSLAEDDRTWLRTRLEALRLRLVHFVPLHGHDNPARDNAVQVALERVNARMRHDVEAHAANPTRPQRTVRNFIEGTLGRLVMDLRGSRDLDPRFLWHDVVALLYIDIDMRAWYRYCHGRPWESLYYDEIDQHRGMIDDLERIRRRREALEQRSLAKSQFVPVTRRRSGVAFGGVIRARV